MWTPAFLVEKESPLVLVWVTLQQLLVSLFDKLTIFANVSKHGCPLRLDNALAILKYPCVARFQIDIDLLKPRTDKAWIIVDHMDGF